MATPAPTRGELALADWPRDLSPSAAQLPGPWWPRGWVIRRAGHRGPLCRPMAGGRTGRVCQPTPASQSCQLDHRETGRPDQLQGKLIAADVAGRLSNPTRRQQPVVGRRWVRRWVRAPGPVVVAATRERARQLAASDPPGLSEVTLSLVMAAPGTEQQA
jgi:hypothetical protein